MKKLLILLLLVLSASSLMVRAVSKGDSTREETQNEMMGTFYIHSSIL